MNDNHINLITIKGPLANPVPFPQCPDKAKCVADVSAKGNFSAVYI
jgi:hypothetical protein